MENSKLIRLLRTFSKSEFKEFEKFVSSPYFADERVYLKLLNELKKNYPDFKSKGLTREKIYAALYPGKKYKDTVIFTITTGLYSLAKEFLADMELRNNEDLKELMINRQFHARGLTEIFHKSFERLHDKLNSDPYDSINIQVLLNADNLAIQHYGLLGKYENLNETFEKHTHNLIISIIEKLSKLVHDIHINQNIYNININNITAYRFTNLFDFDKIPDITSSNKTIRISRIYSHIIKFCFNVNESSYFELKKEIIQNLNSFSKIEQYELFIILTDFCQDLMVKEQGHERELLNLFKQMLNNEIYLDPRYEFMQMALFRNILAISLRNREYNWAEEYVKKYSLKLNPAIRENAYNFSNAYIRFAKKNYVEALQFANKVTFEDFFYKRDIKLLTIQIYYELNYYEEFLSFCDSYKHFLNSNRKINPKSRKRFMNVITYTSIMMNIRNKQDAYPIEKLINEINNDQIVPSKSWLLKKAGEIPE